MPITVLLADDHPVIRRGLRLILDAADDMQVVAEASTGSDAIELALRFRPDIALIDISMPPLSGIDVIRHLRESAPEIRCIVFSMSDSDAHVRDALAHGAIGYLLKGDDGSEIVSAIRTASRTQPVLSPYLQTRFGHDALIETDAVETDAVPTALESLTPREREILTLTISGATSAKIGEHLQISRRTVEVHRANLMRKLGVHSTAQLIRRLPPDKVSPPPDESGDE